MIKKQSHIGEITVKNDNFAIKFRIIKYFV
jgi:hypothetical protein